MQGPRPISRTADTPREALDPAKQVFAKSELKALGRLGRRAVARIRGAVEFYRTGAPRHEQLMTALVFLLGIVIATGGFFAIQYHYRTKAQKAFEGPATQFTAVLAKGLDRYVEVVNSVGAFLTATGEVSRWQFFDFTRETLPRHPGIRALQWIPRVPGGQRAAYEKQAVADGLFGFRFTERNSFGNLVKAWDRPEYYPVFYVEPFEGNEAFLGLDLGGDPGQLEVLALARDIGALVATPRAAPTAESEDPPGFTVVLPVYRSGKVPDTIRERREKLLGFVRGVYRLGDLVTASLPGLTAPPGLDIYLYDQDGSRGERLLYYHRSPLRHDRPDPLPEREVFKGLFTLTTHDLAGWRWSIVVRPVSSEFTYNVNSAAWGFWAITLLLTALLVQHLVSSQIRTQSIERSVTERTLELSTANESLESEIAERTRVEKELRTAKDQAEVANRAKSEFLAMMSHELKTPLNAVIGFAEILCRENLGPIGNQEYRGYAEDIRLSGNHLLSLINDILDLSKIEANRFEVYEEAVDVADTLRSVLPLHQEKITAGRLEFESEFAEPQLGLRADQRALRQMLINLLSNAVKFTPEGGRITVRAGLDDEGRFAVSVSDTGIGISEEDQPRVLLPFNQVDSQLSRKYEGTGLGLPLTKRLMELHGGWLEIDSALGRGTKVSLVFPPDRVIAPATRRGSGAEVGGTEVDGTEAGSGASGPASRVLAKRAAGE
jgi:signal transduction histidine kinase